MKVDYPYKSVIIMYYGIIMYYMNFKLVLGRHCLLKVIKKPSKDQEVTLLLCMSPIDMISLKDLKRLVF